MAATNAQGRSMHSQEDLRTLSSVTGRYFSSRSTSGHMVLRMHQEVWIFVMLRAETVVGA